MHACVSLTWSIHVDSGMNVGWGWGMADPAGIGGTVVANNSIASFCQRLNDCGESRSS